MAGLVPTFERGPITYQVGAQVAGGQLVTPGTGATAALIIPAAANSINCLGVATTDGLPVGTSLTGTTTEGFPSFNAAAVDENVAVGMVGAWKLNATGTFAFGDYVKCGAAGSVVKWVDGNDTPGTRVGQCKDPNGGTSGSKSLIKLFL